MNWAELSVEAADLALIPELPTPARQPVWTTLVNQGVKQFSWDTEYNIEELTLTTVINQAEYTLTSPRWKYFYEVLYGTELVLELTSESRLRNYNALWRMQDAGQPVAYFFPMPSKIRLYPKPDTADDTLYLRGIREASPLTNVTPGTTDELPYPEAYHMACAHWAALIYLRKLYGKTKDEQLRAAIADQIAFCEGEYDRIKSEFVYWLATDDAVIVRRTTYPTHDRIRI